MGYCTLSPLYGVESDFGKTASSSTKFVSQPNKNQYVNLALRWTAYPSNERQIFSARLVRHHIFDYLSKPLELHAARVASSVRTTESRRRRGEEATHYADETSAVASFSHPLRDVLGASLLRVVPFRRLAIKNDDGFCFRTDLPYFGCGGTLIFEEYSYATAPTFLCRVVDAPRPFDAQTSSGRRENTHKQRRFPERKRRKDTHVQLRER